MLHFSASLPTHSSFEAHHADEHSVPKMSPKGNQWSGFHFGEVARGFGYLTVNEIIEALKIQKQAYFAGLPYRRLGEICMARGYLSPEQVEDVLECQIRLNLRLRQMALAPDSPVLLDVDNGRLEIKAGKGEAVSALLAEAYSRSDETPGASDAAGLA